MAPSVPPFKSQADHANDQLRQELYRAALPYQPTPYAAAQAAKAEEHAAVATKDPEDFQRHLEKKHQLRSMFKLVNKCRQMQEKHGRELQAVQGDMEKLKEKHDSELTNHVFLLEKAAILEGVDIGSATLSFSERLTKYISERPKTMTAEQRDQLLDKVRGTYRERMKRAAKAYNPGDMPEDFDAAFLEFVSNAEEAFKFFNTTKPMQDKLLARIEKLYREQEGKDVDSEGSFGFKLKAFLDSADEYINSLRGTDGLIVSLENEIKKMTSTAYGTSYLDDPSRPLKHRMRRYGEFMQRLVKDSNDSHDVCSALQETMDRLDDAHQDKAELQSQIDKLMSVSERYAEALKKSKDNA